MKNIFTSAFLLLAVTAFAQDTKKDTTQLYDFGARIYDSRIGRSMSVGPKQVKENNPYKFADTTAEQYSNTGEDYMKQENYTAAFNSFSKAIQINPIAKYYTKRAVCSMFQSKMKEALVDFDNAIKIDPNYAEAYLFKGSIYQFTEDNDIAIDYYTKAIKANPNYADAYMMRGLLKRTTNKKEACKDLKKAVDLGSQKAISAYDETCK
jgi:tetratricopeptide (TPR) repeat protein